MMGNLAMRNPTQLKTSSQLHHLAGLLCQCCLFDLVGGVEYLKLYWLLKPLTHSLFDFLFHKELH